MATYDPLQGDLYKSAKEAQAAGKANFTQQALIARTEGKSSISTPSVPTTTGAQAPVISPPPTTTPTTLPATQPQKTLPPNFEGNSTGSITTPWRTSQGFNASYTPGSQQDLENVIKDIKNSGDPFADQQIAAITKNFANQQAGTNLSTDVTTQQGETISLNPTSLEEAARSQSALNKEQMSNLDREIAASKKKASKIERTSEAATNAGIGAVGREGVTSLTNPMAAGTISGTLQDDLSRSFAQLDWQRQQLAEAQSTGDAKAVENWSQAIKQTQNTLMERQIQYSQVTSSTLNNLLSNNALATGDPNAIAGVATQLQNVLGIPSSAAQGMAEGMAKYQMENFGSTQKKNLVAIAQGQANILGTYIDKGIPISEADYLSMSQQSGIPVNMFMETKARIDATNARTDIDTETKKLLNQKALAELPYAAAKAAQEASPYEFRTVTDPNTGLSMTEVWNKLTGQRVNNPSSLFGSPPQNVTQYDYQGQNFIGYEPSALSSALGIDPATFKAQCGEMVNDATGIGVGDTYASKLSKTDPNITTPQPGMVFVMPTASQYGHVGIVAGVSTDGNSILAYDTNWHDKTAPETLQVHTIPTDQITGYARPSANSKLGQFTQSNAPASLGQDNEFFAGLTDKGKQVFSNLTPVEQSNVQQLIEGDALMSDLITTSGAAGSIQRQKLLRQAQQVDPNFSENTNKARYKFVTEWNDPNSKSFQTRTAVNTALGHLGEMVDTFNDLSKMDAGVLTMTSNKLQNWLDEHSGDGRVQKFNLARDNFASEIAAAYKGGVPDKEEVQDRKEALNAALSKGGFKSVSDLAATMLASKIAAVGDEYKKVMGKYPIDSLINDATLTHLKSANVDTTGLEKIMNDQSPKKTTGPLPTSSLIDLWNNSHPVNQANEKSKDDLWNSDS